MAQIVISFLRGEVFNRFKESMKNSDSIGKNLENEKKRKKEFSMNWKYLSEDLKKKLLLLGIISSYVGHTSLEGLVNWMNSNNINLKIKDL